MNLQNDIHDIDLLRKELASTLKSSSDFEAMESEQDFLQLDILEYVSDLLKERNITRTQLAQKMGVTKSFISQLFSADKRLNLEHLVKFQRILDLKFKISDKSHSKISNPGVMHVVRSMAIPASNAATTTHGWGKLQSKQA
jgi:antitoxin component HigA of HigAB toxin-antitoxin module